MNLTLDENWSWERASILEGVNFEFTAEKIKEAFKAAEENIKDGSQGLEMALDGADTVASGAAEGIIRAGVLAETKNRR